MNERKCLVIMGWDSESEVREAVIIDESHDTFNTTQGHFYKCNCFPMSARQAILNVIKQRYVLKQAYDDSFKLVLELSNKRSRGEFGSV